MAYAYLFFLHLYSISAVANGYMCVCVSAWAQLYITYVMTKYTHKSAFQFKHAFNLEDLGRQMSMYKDIQDYIQTSKKGGTFAIMHTYV